MSFNRFVYYSAVIGGWAAFVAWGVAELSFLGRQWLGGIAEAVLTAALVGALLGAGLSVVSGSTGARWTQRLKRATPGLVGGGIGGALGGLAGAILYSELGLPRAIGWLIMGVGIGVAEGIYERRPRKIRNGLVGGSVGGLVGGILFDPIATAGSDLPSRATAFVILGLCVGALVGLAHVVFKEAWLTVVDGYRPGRQLILSSPQTTLGRGDHLPLPFLGYAGRDLDNEHLRIIRRPDGRYTCEDNNSRIGTKINNQPVQSTVVLSDGDLIRLGTNIVRFNHRKRDATRDDIPIRGVDELVPSSPGLSAPPPPRTSPAPLPAPHEGVAGAQPPVPSKPSAPDPAPDPRSAPRIPPPPPPPQ
jgi:hypothetical protein